MWQIGCKKVGGDCHDAAETGKNRPNSEEGGYNSDEPSEISVMAAPRVVWTMPECRSFPVVAVSMMVSMDHEVVCRQHPRAYLVAVLDVERGLRGGCATSRED